MHGHMNLKFEIILLCSQRTVQDATRYARQRWMSLSTVIHGPFLQSNSETKYFYLTERSILLLTISALNTDCYMHQNYYTQRKILWPYISHCA